MYNKVFWCFLRKGLEFVRDFPQCQSVGGHFFRFLVFVSAAISLGYLTMQPNYIVGDVIFFIFFFLILIVNMFIIFWEAIMGSWSWVSYIFVRFWIIMVLVFWSVLLQQYAYFWDTVTFGYFWQVTRVWTPLEMLEWVEYYRALYPEVIYHPSAASVHLLSETCEGSIALFRERYLGLSLELGVADRVNMFSYNYLAPSKSVELYYAVFTWIFPSHYDFLVLLDTVSFLYLWDGISHLVAEAILPAGWVFKTTLGVSLEVPFWYKLVALVFSSVPPGSFFMFLGTDRETKLTNSFSGSDIPETFPFEPRVVDLVHDEKYWPPLSSTSGIAWIARKVVWDPLSNHGLAYSVLSVFFGPDIRETNPNTHSPVFGYFRLRGGYILAMAIIRGWFWGSTWWGEEPFRFYTKK